MYGRNEMEKENRHLHPHLPNDGVTLWKVDAPLARQKMWRCEHMVSNHGSVVGIGTGVSDTIEAGVLDWIAS